MEIWIPQMTRSGQHKELLQKVLFALSGDLGESVNCCTSVKSWVWIPSFYLEKQSHDSKYL